jgi:ComF family protein
MVVTIVLDTLFPPKQEVLLIRDVSTEQFLRLAHRFDHHGTTVLAPYKQPVVRAAIHAHKFYAHRHATRLLTALLLEELATYPEGTYYVPIPLGKKRARARGHNQVTTLLRSAGATSVLLEDALIRTRETTEQSHLPRNERLRNVRGAFTYNTKYPPEQFAHRTIVLVDDVVTTGTTLIEAANTLRRALPQSTRVTCLALAH